MLNQDFWCSKKLGDNLGVPISPMREGERPYHEPAMGVSNLTMRSPLKETTIPDKVVQERVVGLNAMEVSSSNTSKPSSDALSSRRGKEVMDDSSPIVDEGRGVSCDTDRKF